MRVCITDTNCSVAGLSVPVGWGGINLGGTGNVVGSWGSTNVSVGSGDLLVVDGGGAKVVVGPDLFQCFLEGFAVLVLIAMVGLVRRFSRQLAGDARSDI